MRQSGTRIEDYSETAGKRREDTLGTYGSQPGDPKRAAEAILTVVRSENPPLRLLLGADALNVAKAKLDRLRTDFDGWRELILSTAYPE
ncbi:hypothetical protein AB0L53_51145 [Nonomuraea sp. NPDC052129]|uniref:hypothetical protein n=1 Tax=unclassified Nonomuraea TaxID=2593643 RepID=UPI0033F4FBAA